jgi:hypothetical protein
LYDSNKQEHVLWWSIISILAGVIASGIYAVNWDRPSVIYMPTNQSDEVEQEPIFIDKEKLPADFDGWILQNNDKETPMAKFSGNMVTVEYVRVIVSSFIIVYIFCMIVIATGFTIRKNW